MMVTTMTLLLLALLFVAVQTSVGEHARRIQQDQQVIFRPGPVAGGGDCLDGSRCFVCFRIPALAGGDTKLMGGRLFAFAEARTVTGCDDHGAPGSVVLVVKYSDDMGCESAVSWIVWLALALVYQNKSCLP